MILSTLILTAVLGAQPGDHSVVENDAVALVLSSRGAIRSMVDKRTGRELVADDATAPLFRFTYSVGQQAAATKSCHASEAKQLRVEPWSNGADQGAKLTFEGFAEKPIALVCTVFLRGDDDQVRFGLEATLPEGVTLQSITYPIVEAKLSDGDAVVAGNTKGGVLRPSAWKVGRARRYDQPGSLAAAFGCCYNDRGGVYTAAYDSQGYQKSVFFKKRAVRGLELGWFRPCFVRERFTLPYESVLAAFSSPESGRPTDWRDAADKYKAWAIEQSWCAKTFADRDDLPEWVKQGPAMVRFTRAWLSEPERIESWLRDYWHKEYPQGTPLIISYWGWEHGGKWVGPEYFPAYPSDEQFGRLVRCGREVGGHTFLWPSGYNMGLCYGQRPDGSYLWDNRDQLEAARPHAVVDRMGKPMIRDCIWLRGGQQCVLCPGDPWTIEWLNRSAVECVRHGADVIQIDQVVGGRYPFCYSRTHGHPQGPGLWASEAFHRQLETMARDCRAAGVNAVLGCEEPNEWYIQQFGIQDYRDCDVIWGGGEPASVFSYLYHEYLPTLFQSNLNHTGQDPWAMAWCLVTGQVPHLIARLGIGPGPMVIDGGFERWSDEGPVEFPRTMLFPGERWSMGETGVDHVERHGGSSSLKLHSRKPTEQAMASQNYAVTEHFRPGQTYRFSVWMRSQGINRPNGVSLKALAPGMSLLQSWTIPYPEESSQWSRGQVDFRMPEGTVVLRVLLPLNGPGAVWLDDLKIEELSGDGTVTEVQRPALPVDHDFMRQWITLYHGAGRPYLALGKMLHPPRLETAELIPTGTRNLPPVLHNAFEAPDGSQAVVLANWTTKPQKVYLTWNNRRRAVELRANEIRLIRD